MNRLQKIIILLAGAALAQSGLALDVYVDPTAGETGNGTRVNPFNTIDRAQAAVRQRVARGLQEDITVHLRGGIYWLDHTLMFGPEDGGCARYSVTYTGYPGERPILSGGRTINGFKRGQDGIWTTQLDDVKDGTWWFRQFYADDRRLARGRYPQEDFLKIKTVSKDCTKLRFAEALPAADLGGSDTEVVVVQNWSISRELIARSNAETLTAETQIGWVGHMACLPKPGMSVFLEHALAFLNEPGQWYLDRKTGVLSYKAAPGEDANQKHFVAPVLRQLIDIQGYRDRPVRNLHFEGLSFEHTAFLMPDIGYGGIQACYHGTSLAEAVTYAVDAAIELDYAENCSLSNCSLQRIGGSAIGLGAGCHDNRIVGCVIADIGATGVNIGHMKVKHPLWADWSNVRDVPVNNEVANCTIHHCGAELWGAHGIFDAMTRGTHIHHNDVAHIPYGGIATGFVWGTERTSQQGCVIEYNHIHEVMLKLNDSGCIYTLGFQPGSIIRGNLMHGVRIGGFAGGAVCNNGIFMDEGSKGFLIEDNVVYDVDQRPGARNTPVRFNRSSRDWQIWINNTFVTDAVAPEAAQALAAKAGLEEPYRDLPGDGAN